METRRNSTHGRGFTIIELMVVMGIVTVIYAVTLASYSRFGGQTLLRSLAYDIALTIRQTQVHGISARIFSGSVADVYGHGVLFDLSIPGGDRQFVLYADTNRDRFFTSVASGELVDVYRLGRGHTIDDICYVEGGNAEMCGVASRVDVLFVRPEPDAIIRVYNGQGWIRAESFRIVLQSPHGSRLSVVVERGGQISVQRVN